MLTQMRNITRGWIAGGLIALLVLAFAIWGINDVFSGASGNAVARVAGQDVSAQDVNRELDFVIRNRQDEQGGRITRADAIAQGAPAQILDGIISRRALAAFVERLGVHADPVQIADAIRAFPNAQNPITQTFDREAYNAFLNDIGYTPAEFEREIGAGIALNEVLSSLTAGARAPSSFGKIVLAFQSERRVVTLAEVPAARAEPVPAPTDAQVEETYQQLRAQFAVPEFRALTLIVARPEDFVARVSVPETDIRAEFDAEAPRLTQPEKRSFAQVTAPTPAAAQDAAARLARGEEPDAVAAAVGGQAVVYVDQARADIPDPDIATAVFALPADAAPRVVRGRLAANAAVRLDAVTPAVTPSFEAERDRIRGALAEAEATDLLNAAVEAFNDARAEGQPVVAAARAHGLSVIEAPAIDAQGRSRDGETPDILIDQGALIEAAFQLPEGEASEDFIAGPDGADIIIQVNSVTPATTRPLAEVRDDVVAFWTARERADRLTAIGQRVNAAVDGGQSFEAAAQANGARIVQANVELDRRMASQIPAQQLAQLLFGARVGAVVADLRADGEALILAQVKEIRRTDPAEDPASLEQARQAFQQQLGPSIAQAVEAEAVRAADVQRAGRYEQALNRAFPRADAGAESEE
ncbi:MAG: SurA N-terminal domain-containing protein [Hyphomonadaceae bacterium]|nr:SurA N-terminal domain-containing protein [Hyphomonadaceae bacterium]